MNSYFQCGCVVVRDERGNLISATPCELHQPLGTGQALVDALESPHLTIATRDEISVQSVFGKR